MTADWWNALHSAFAGLDSELCLYETVEELEGVELSKYLTVGEGTDESREKYQGLAQRAESALSPPLGVEPLDHWHNKLKKVQGKKHRRGGLEIVTIVNVGIGQEARKEHRAELVKWSKALKDAEKSLKDTKIDPRNVARAVLDRAIEIAPNYGVSPQLIHAMQNEKYIETRKTCVIPQLGLAAAAFCSRLARRSQLDAEAKKSPEKKQAPLRPPWPKVVPIGNLNELKRMKSLRQVQAAAELDYSTRQVRYLLRNGKLTKTAKGRVAVDDKFEEQSRLRHSARPK